MSSKCSFCHSCYTVLHYLNQVYRYCTLCQKLYKTLPGGTLVEETDTEIIRAIQHMVGKAI